MIHSGFMKIKTDKKINDAYKSQLKVKRGVNGLGLFTFGPIKKSDYIIEYFGPLLNDEQVQERGGKYLFEIRKNKTIDGTDRKNIARYINHSCRPNCEVEIKKERVLIYAKRGIQPEEELNYDYGKEYWNEYIKPKGCRCAKCKEKELLTKNKSTNGA